MNRATTAVVILMVSGGLIWLFGQFGQKCYDRGWREGREAACAIPSVELEPEPPRTVEEIVADANEDGATFLAPQEHAIVVDESDRQGTVSRYERKWHTPDRWAVIYRSRIRGGDEFVGYAATEDEEAELIQKHREFQETIEHGEEVPERSR